jgi:hypothetical protein
MRKLGLLGALLALLAAGSAQAGSPYPPSTVITGMSWDRASYVFDGVGGDLWPMTWAADDSLRTAYGDGQIGCPVYVSYGTVAITTEPPSLALQGVGCGPTGNGHGKIMALGAAGSVLFGRMGQQSKAAPYPIARSTDGGRSWQKPGWSPVFATTAFVQFGKGNEGAPDGYVYVISVTNGTTVQLTRFPPAKWNVSSAYQYFSGTAAAPAWSSRLGARRPIFHDPAGARQPTLQYVPGLQRYLLTAAHTRPGQVGVFDAPNMYGPWTTSYYANDWLGLGTRGLYFSIYFPLKWQSADGRTLWATFSCHNGGQTGGCGQYHDRLNMVRATLQVRAGGN